MSAAFTPSWEENASNCSICGAKLGKRHLTPRHHCRLCGRSVCSGCSPSSVQLSGQDGPRRACTECVTDILKTAEMKGRIGTLANRLRVLAGASSCVDLSFEESVIFCENALEPVEQEKGKFKLSRSRLEDLERQLAAARAACIRLCQRIYASRRSSPPAGLQTASLDEALRLCEEALGSPEVPRRSLVVGSLWSIDTGAARARRSIAEPLHGRESENCAAIGSATRGSESAGAGWCCIRSPGSSRWPWRRCASLMVCFVVTVAAAVASTLVVVHFCSRSTGISQHMLDSAPLSFGDGLTMSEPTSTGLRLQTELVLPISVQVSARLPAFRASLRSAHSGAGGPPFGWLTVPETRIEADVMSKIVLDTYLHVTDAGAFAKSFGRILQGELEEWEITGTLMVYSMGHFMSLSLCKNLSVPAVFMDSLRADGVDLAHGKESELATKLDLSFFSSSVLKLRDLGPLTFEVRLGDRPLEQAGAAPRIGRMTVPSFTVAQGVNALRNASFVLEKDAASEALVSAFLGRWLSGQDQQLLVSGPVGSTIPFLERALRRQPMFVAGLSNGLVKFVEMNGFHTFLGHDRQGKPCNRLVGSHCLQGPIVTFQNKLHHVMTLRDVSLDVDLMEELAYDVTLHSLRLLRRTSSCNRGRSLMRLRSLPGMWAQVNASRALDESVLVPAVQMGSERRETVLTAAFLAKEMPPDLLTGESSCLGDPRGDCCFASAVSAAACLALSRDHLIARSTLKGNLTLEVGTFNTTISVEQRGVPIGFTDDVRSLRVGAATASCRDFVFAISG